MSGDAEALGILAVGLATGSIQTYTNNVDLDYSQQPSHHFVKPVQLICQRVDLVFELLAAMGKGLSSGEAASVVAHTSRKSATSRS